MSRGRAIYMDYFLPKHGGFPIPPLSFTITLVGFLAQWKVFTQLIRSLRPPGPTFSKDSCQMEASEGYLLR